MTDLYTDINNDFLRIESQYEDLYKNKPRYRNPDYVNRRIDRAINTNKYVKIVKYAQENQMNNLIERTENSFRICTYNVHYFSKNIIDKNLNDSSNLPKITETNNINMITEALVNINPDILCTQEIIFGVIKDEPDNLKTVQNECLDENCDANKIFNNIGLSLVSFCSVIPSWFKVPYGNAIWINNNFKDKLKICKDLSCSDLQQDYDILPKNKNYVKDPKLVETKCFIKITLFNKIDIVCLHLDAVSKNIKLNMLQLDKINSVLDKPTIITGDFNLVRRIDNLKSNEYVDMIHKRYGWVEAFDAIGISHTLTSSDLTEKDYFFFAKFENYDLKELIQNVSVYFTDASDHLPLILDLNINYINQKIISPVTKQRNPWPTKSPRSGTNTQIKTSSNYPKKMY